ncbi:N-acetylmuramoyl-L-alanine amidase [Sphingomonas sp. XMGL2]|uniref:N-acetylmuramoyl-L-alanine amidase n=2 Tax=Sphingomonas quercus TaxID=2842451 RepID=A0ABS6BJ19_9SPHN|nr:N-acetylmuramoyl-L-alanine amidase [Sphingomonas quercus]
MLLPLLAGLAAVASAVAAPDVGRGPAAIKAAQSASPPVSEPARGRGRPLVVIDPGHGGHDPGTLAAGGSVAEKRVVLATALAIRDALVRSGRVRVALTRADDRFLPLTERVAIARRLKADLFLSIHADSAPNRAARGASVYTLSDVASDREAARLASRENSADRFGGLDLRAQAPDVRSILADLAQRETMNESAAFARLLRQQTDPVVRFRTVAHRFANFSVLRSGGIPAVLYETGYLSNAADAAFLQSAAGRRAIAEGARRAVEMQLARIATGPRPAP